MNYNEAIEAIKSNYPTEQYTMLREALDLAISVLQEKADEQLENGTVSYEFIAYDWDEMQYISLPTSNVVEAIHIAWNYEFDVFAGDENNKIFSGKVDNETNSEWLKPYGIRMIDDPDGKYRVLQDIKTGNIYRPSWQ